MLFLFFAASATKHVNGLNNSIEMPLTPISFARSYNNPSLMRLLLFQIEREKETADELFTCTLVNDVSAKCRETKNPLDLTYMSLCFCSGQKDRKEFVNKYCSLIELCIGLAALNLPVHVLLVCDEFARVLNRHFIYFPKEIHAWEYGKIVKQKINQLI